MTDVVHIRLSKERKAKFRKWCKAHGVSMTWKVDKMIEEFLKDVR